MSLIAALFRKNKINMRTYGKRPAHAGPLIKLDAGRALFPAWYPYQVRRTTYFTLIVTMAVVLKG